MGAEHAAIGIVTIAEATQGADLRLDRAYLAGEVECLVMLLQAFGKTALREQQIAAQMM